MILAKKKKKKVKTKMWQKVTIAVMRFKAQLTIKRTQLQGSNGI